MTKLYLEKKFWHKGQLVAGLDEAGRGAWAGPVAAGAVILPPSDRIKAALNGVRDSKQMTPLARERWADQIKQQSLSWSVGFASAQEIDRIGILPATRLASVRALEGLSLAPAHLLHDHLKWEDCPLTHTSLVRGESESLSIAAASVLAKTARDAWMRELDEKFPGYGFARHKGYGTRLHQKAIAQFGLCAEHRKSFRIMKEER
jgi:ribonuclease HII